jgi:vacuolar-type H+-ATPase subunit H
MVEKHLDAIRGKEEEARQRLAETAKEAELLMEDARAEGEKLIEDTKIKGNELIRSMAAGAKQEARRPRPGSRKRLDSTGRRRSS